MLIGLDFDNTIVSYESALSFLADKTLSLPPEIPRTKLEIRDFLRACGREVEWTSFQGLLYGPGMEYAKPFEGAIEVLHDLAQLGHHLVIVSHRSPHPYAGPPFDLHKFAREWISKNLKGCGLFHDDAVYFLPTKSEKIDAIRRIGSNVFLDDLPEVLLDEFFPKSAKGILFDPSSKLGNLPIEHQITSWCELPTVLRKITRV